MQNVISNLNIKDRVFKGPSSSNTIGTVSQASAGSYIKSLFKDSEFHWLSLYNGFLEEKSSTNDLSKIIESIGFPIILNSYPIIKALKNSIHKGSLKLLSPAIIRSYLHSNRDRWEDGAIPREEVLQLFEYILQDNKFNSLEGFKMIPLADGTLGILTRYGDSNVYLDPDDNYMNHRNGEIINERDIFTNQLYKFIDKSIVDSGLYKRLCENAKARWNLNIKILDEYAVIDMIKCSLDYARNKNREEIPMSNNLRGWIYQLWNNIYCRNWNLGGFEDIHLIPTSRSTLRKLITPERIFSSKTNNNVPIESLIPTFEKFGAVFIDNNFDKGWYK